MSHANWSPRRSKYIRNTISYKRKIGKYQIRNYAVSVIRKRGVLGQGVVALLPGMEFIGFSSRKPLLHKGRKP